MLPTPLRAKLTIDKWPWHDVHVQGISYWNVKSNLGLTDRNMLIGLCLKVSVWSWGLDIWVLSTNFQKSNIDWPQQPPIEKVLKFSKNFHDSVKIILVLRLLNSRTRIYSPISLKKFLILMIWSSMAPRWPIIVIFCGMDNQKSKFLLIHGIFSVRGCWGQSRLLFWKLDDESQISKTQDHTDTFK